ncbi:MFS transporter, partial [Streptomyces nanshensis]
MSAGTGDGWGAVLRVRHSSGLLIATLVGRLPTCMGPIVLLLAVREAGGGYAWGGILAAVYRLAIAVGQPLMGRLADHLGQTLPIAGGALISAMAHACLVLPHATTSHAGLLLVLAAGLSAPPLEAGMRALWPQLVPEHRLPVAYSVDNAFMQAAHILGPLLTVACFAAGGARGALGTMALLGV